jgi:hypothetical protein
MNGDVVSRMLRQIGTSGERVAVGSLVALALVYTVIAFGVLKPDATYSIDTTVKYVQARTLLASGFLQSSFENRGAFVDPGGKFLPFTPPYVFPTSTGWQSIFPTASALLWAPFSRWGLAGVTMPALAGACLLLWATWRFGRNGPGEQALPAVLGAGTILWFYATSPNEHGLAAALTTAALIAAVRDGRWSLVAAGFLLGLAGILRDEALLVAPGLVIARYVAGTRSPLKLAAQAALMAGACLVPLLAIAALDSLVYQRPASAHLLHAMPVLQRWLPPESVKGLPALPEFTWGDKADILVQQWLVGVGTPVEKLLVAVALVTAVAVRRWTGSALGLVAVLGGLAAWQIADVVTLLSAPKFVSGLYRLCPFLVFALVPLPKGTTPSPLRRLALATAACYLLLAFAGLGTVGGKSFGPRLLFPLLPLLTVAAVQSIAAWAGRIRTSGVDGTVGAIGITLVGVAVMMQIGVALPAWTVRNRLDYQLIAHVDAANDPVVVLDHPSTVQMTARFYFDRAVFLATTEQTAAELAGLLSRAHVRSMSVVVRGPLVGYPPFSLLEHVKEGRSFRQRWVR